MTNWTLAIIESPYGGTPSVQQRNIRYLRACMNWCVNHGYSPYASHAQLTQPGVLRDEDPDERRKGIDAGLAWKRVADTTLFFLDRGRTPGMNKAMALCRSAGLDYDTVSIGPNWEQEWLDRVSVAQSMAWTDRMMDAGLLLDKE
jgi:hypothetical protein